QDSITLVIEASSHRLHTSRLASSPPGLPLTCMYAGHIVVAVSLAALGPTQMSSFFSLFFSYSFRLGRATHSRNFAAVSHPHPLPLDRDPATPTWPRHPGSTDPATTKTPPRWRHLDTVAAVTSLRRFHQHRPPRPRCTGAVSTRPPPPPRLPSPPASFTRPLLIGAVSTRHATGTATPAPPSFTRPPPHGAVSTRPPPPPDSTRHTGTAATATSPLHLSPPHLYY
ncbi:hypothetical protein EDB85DRAFT_2034326, partial [Lactarius pseudohatsudake]